MRFLLLCKKIPFPVRDGESIAISGLAKALADRGCEITLLGMSTPKHPYLPEEVPPAFREKIRIIPVPVHNPVRITGVLSGFFRKTPYHVIRFHSTGMEISLEELLQRETFDVVQFEGLYLTQYAAIVRKYSDSLLVYRSHNIEADIWSRLANRATRLWIAVYFRDQARKLRNYERKVLPHFDAVLPISEDNAGWYAGQLDAAKVYFLPSGVSGESQIMLAGDPDPRRLFFLGALDWRPNAEGLNWFLERVFPLLRKAVPDAEIHIAGRNAPAHGIPAHREGVYWYGEIAGAGSFVADKWISVVPLLAGSGLKIKIMEAIAWGRPIVTTSIGAEGIPASLVQYLYIGDTPEQFAAHCRNLIEHPETARMKAVGGRDYIRSHFNNASLAGGLLGFYKTLRWG